MKYLFLDDERIPADVTWVSGFDPNLPWHIVRSYDEAVSYVEQNGIPNVVSFDHDLGSDYTGLSFAFWLASHDLDYHTMPDDFSYMVHSMNPVGKVNIIGTLESYLNFRKNAKYT